MPRSNRSAAAIRNPTRRNKISAHDPGRRLSDAHGQCGRPGQSVGESGLNSCEKLVQVRTKCDCIACRKWEASLFEKRGGSSGNLGGQVQNPDLRLPPLKGMNNNWSA